MEKPSQLFCLRFADGALPVKYLGSNSFRAEYFPEVFLSQAARLHQMLECPLRTCLPNWIAPLLVLVNEHGQHCDKPVSFPQAFSNLPCASPRTRLQGSPSRQGVSARTVRERLVL